MFRVQAEKRAAAREAFKSNQPSSAEAAAAAKAKQASAAPPRAQNDCPWWAGGGLVWMALTHSLARSRLPNMATHSLTPSSYGNSLTQEASKEAAKAAAEEARAKAAADAAANAAKAKAKQEALAEQKAAAKQARPRRPRALNPSSLSVVPHSLGRYLLCAVSITMSTCPTHSISRAPSYLYYVFLICPSAGPAGGVGSHRGDEGEERRARRGEGGQVTKYCSRARVGVADPSTDRDGAVLL